VTILDRMYLPEKEKIMAVKKHIAIGIIDATY